MRSKNAVKNLFFYLLLEAMVLILGLVFPRLIITTYGSAINGLTSTITRVLSLINLIQAGAVGAAIFQMYKPVAMNDYETQSAILYTSKHFYRKFSVAYLLISLVAAVFLGMYLRDEKLSFLEVFFPFVILSVNGASVLLFNSICDIYVSSHQKRYYLSIAAIFEQIVRYSLLTVVIVFKANFIFIYLCYLAGGLVGIIINVFVYKRLTKGLITNSPNNKKYRIPGRKYLMLSSIGSEAVTASPAIIITTIVGLVETSVFSVYSMVFTSMKTVLNSIQLSFSAVFGNLVKTSTDEKIADVYSSIELLTIGLGTFLASCVGFLIMPFVLIYTKNADANYLYNSLGVFVVAYVLLFAFRTAFGYVATVYGLFKDTCIIVLVFGIVGIAISILSVILFGMPFVMVGLLFNQLGCSIATLVVIKKKISWFKIKKLFLRAAIMVIIASVSTSSYFIFDPVINSWLWWLLYAFVVALCAIALFLIYCLIFERNQLKRLFYYIKVFLKRKET